MVVELITNHKIIVGDAKNMTQLSDASVDMVITSPPYPMIEMWDELFTQLNPEIGREIKNGNGMDAFNLMNQELDKIWREVNRVMKPGGFVCINIGDATRTVGKEFRLYSNHSAIIRCFEEMNYDVLPMIIWRKQTNKPNKFMGSGMLPGGAYVTLEHEYILIFRKYPKRVLSSADKEIRRQSSYFWEERNTWFSDVWFDLKGIGQILKTKSSRSRSAAYPLDLPYRLINMYSLQGDLILDPFLGTGTTTKAAMISGRNSVGYEIDPVLVSSEDGIHSKFDSIKNDTIRIVDNRIKAHHKFVKQRIESGKEIKHISEFYGFPVMTTQERELKIPIILTVTRKDNNYKIKHSFEKQIEKSNIDNWF